MEDFRMPKVAMSDDEEMLITQWLLGEGAAFSDGQPLLEVETAKASMEIEAPMAGVLARQLCQPGDTVLAGDLIARLAAPGETFTAEDLDDSPASERESMTPPADSAPSPEAGSVPPPSGSEDTTASQSRVSAPGLPTAVAVPAPAPVAGDGQARPRAGTAPDGPKSTVALSDSAPGELYGIPERKRGRSTSQASLPTVRAANAPTREPLSRHRRALGRLMAQSAAIPQFAVQRDLPMLAAHRMVEQLRAAGVRATLTDVLLKAIAHALVQHPEMNSQFTGEDLYRYPDPAIALAADSPGGVVAPVVRDAHLLDWAGLAAERRRVVEGARNGRLLPADMTGGTFAFSNVGALGGDSVIPMLTPPQVGILGLGRTKPGWGETVAHGVLVADHRVLDGADSARFLATLAQLLDGVDGAYPVTGAHRGE